MIPNTENSPNFQYWKGFLDDLYSCAGPRRSTFPLAWQNHCRSTRYQSIAIYKSSVQCLFEPFLTERYNQKPKDTYTNSTLGVTQTLGVDEQKILSIRWNMVGDQFIIDVNVTVTLAKELQPTKKVVSVVGRFYDPLGFVSPVVIRFKIFFQELC